MRPSQYQKHRLRCILELLEFFYEMDETLDCSCSRRTAGRGCSITECETRRVTHGAGYAGGRGGVAAVAVVGHGGARRQRATLEKKCESKAAFCDPEASRGGAMGGSRADFSTAVELPL